MEHLSGLARRLAAPLRGADAAFARVATDTRALAAGDLFVALKGERFDGHEFVRRAGELGAAGALVSAPVDCGLPQVVVPDTLRALQDYAASWRGDFSIPVVGVTGSTGKTTTKQMLAAVFAARGPVLATQGNLNNHIGVPLTLLTLRPEHRTAVIEMGANHLGEIALLASIARPDVGVVTQAGDAHLEGFGSREGVARGKGEMFSGLRGRGVAVINADDRSASLWKQLAGGASILTFGFDAEADVRALRVEPFPEEAPSGMRFELRAPEGRVTVELNLPGRHNVANALAAAACGVALGMDLADIAAGLARVQPVAGRLSWKATPEGARLLDDTYNANPTSLRAGLELLGQVAGERWLVLGNMGELGPDSAQIHFEAGKTAKAMGVQRLFTVGELAQAAARGFGAGAQHFGDAAELAQALRPQLSPKVVALVKGSRSSRMERVVAALTLQDEHGGH
ncbi:MAG: UDP-N-acetylmuramoyl-tripeptide--D-alanyl-D-alanine ligase [Gammaproteobacteria bacterium]|nr:UDP-N-acetylmuramoyl-tripeptide--D-alanyl-D-alanine ligase [Gammaproteobacteria bacterium]